MSESNLPGPAHSDSDSWACRDSDEYPLVGRERKVELAGETVTATAVAGWVKDGRPAKLTVQTPEGFYHVIDQEQWNV